MHVVDGGVPHPLLDALRHGFSPNARFWKAHKYGQPGTGYFSYCYPVHQEPQNIVEAYKAEISRGLRTKIVGFSNEQNLAELDEKQEEW